MISSSISSFQPHDPAQIADRKIETVLSLARVKSGEAVRKFLSSFLMIAAVLMASWPATGVAADYMVYSVYQSLDLGNTQERKQKDFYVNLGTSQGVKVGSLLEVRRKMSSYDLVSQQLYKDMSLPVAVIKVIYVESSAGIARLEKLLPPDEAPAVNPRAVMVGDLVRPIR